MFQDSLSDTLLLLFNNSVRHTYSVYKENYHDFFHV